MTDFYVRSTTGLDTNDGLSWATAKATVRGAIDAPCAAGDRIFVSQAHAESSAATKFWSFPGTPALPNKVLCVSDVDPVPTTLAGPVTFAGGGSGGTTAGSQGSVHIYGAEIGIGLASALTVMSSTGTDTLQVYEKCYWNFTNSGNTTVLTVGSNSTSNSARSRMLWIDTDVRFAGNQRINLYQELTWRGGTLRAGATNLSCLFNIGAQGRSCPVLVEGVDLGGLNTTTDLVNGAAATGRVMFRNCALPPNWAGNLVQGTIDPGLRVEMHNCDSGGTNYALRVAAFSGTIRSETAVVKTGGASDGATGVSWKIETNANPTPGSLGLETPEFIKWNTTVGAELTVSVDVLSDAGALTSAEVWLDVQYMGAPGSPKGSFVSSRATLAASVVPVSVATWPAGSARTPQRLSVKFTPQKAGAIHCRVVLAKPNAAVFVDPKILVS